MSALSGWHTFNERQKVRCECGRILGEVAPGAIVKVRVRPKYRVQGDRHLSQKCGGCSAEIDFIMESAA